MRRREFLRNGTVAAGTALAGGILGRSGGAAARILISDLNFELHIGPILRNEVRVPVYGEACRKPAGEGEAIAAWILRRNGALPMFDKLYAVYQRGCLIVIVEHDLMVSGCIHRAEEKAIPFGKRLYERPGIICPSITTVKKAASTILLMRFIRKPSKLLKTLRHSRYSLSR